MGINIYSLDHELILITELIVHPVRNIDYYIPLFALREVIASELVINYVGLLVFTINRLICHPLDHQTLNFE